MPRPVPPTGHGFKYRLVYIVEGERVIGFDNERGKGDHRHRPEGERPYGFVGVGPLRDFVEAVEAWRRDHGKD